MEALTEVVRRVEQVLRRKVKLEAKEARTLKAGQEVTQEAEQAAVREVM